MITGSRAVSGSARIARRNSNPSSPGIITSVRTRSGRELRIAASAACAVGDGLDVKVSGQDPAQVARASRSCRRRRARDRRQAIRERAEDGRRLGVSSSVSVQRSASARNVSAAIDADGRSTAVSRAVGAAAAGRSGNPDGERGAAADVALDRDLPLMQVNQLRHQRQPDPAPLGACAPGSPSPDGSARTVAAARPRESRFRCRSPAAQQRRPGRDNLTVMLPCHVCLSAFEMRLSTIFSHISTST